MSFEERAPSSAPVRVAYIVDDDVEIRLSIGLLLKSCGIDFRPFASATDYLAQLSFLRPGCCIIDIRMPDKDGIALLEELVQIGCDWPVIIITGQAEVTAAVRAMKLGAIEFLEKPFTDQELLNALDQGFQKLAETSDTREARSKALSLVNRLTPRERRVLEGVAEGRSNKEIARQLGLSHRTVEMYRANMMRRLGVERIHDLIKMSVNAGITAPVNRARSA